MSADEAVAYGLIDKVLDKRVAASDHARRLKSRPFRAWPDNCDATRSSRQIPYKQRVPPARALGFGGTGVLYRFQRSGISSRNGAKMTDDTRGRHDDGKLLYCSFCGKSQHEVRKLIAGPSVFVCDECVELCNDIIREELEDKRRARARQAAQAARDQEGPRRVRDRPGAREEDAVRRRVQPLQAPADARRHRRHVARTTSRSPRATSC